jgi:small subunit ribosomal protein S17
MTERALDSSDRGRQQVKVGTVISDKMDKTVVVAVRNSMVHSLYRRQMKRTSKFYVHDEANECRAGDEVQIVSSKPGSRLKRWRVQQILKRAEGS